MVSWTHNRHDFQVLSLLRIKEAEVLLSNQCYAGAYYLLGYAIECALKACIAKATKRHDFPPNLETVRAIYIHDLAKLLKSAGLEPKHQHRAKTKPTFARYWAIVKDWNEQVRYQTAIPEQDARDLHLAVTDKRHGVLPWLIKLW